MALQANSGFGFNSVVWISSLNDKDIGVTRRITEDVSDALRRAGLDFEFDNVQSADELHEKFATLLKRVGDGLKPIIQLDMHALPEGAKIAATNELIPWREILPKFQAINVARKNNLAVIASTCFAYQAMRELPTILEPCPIYMLIAPLGEVPAGFFEDKIAKFYESLLSTRNVTGAYEAHLSPVLRAFYSESFLGDAIARHLQDACMGKGLRARRERLLSEIMLEGREATPEDLKRIRASLKANIRPEKSLLDRYAASYLVGRVCPFSFEELMAFAKGNGRTASR